MAFETATRSNEGMYHTPEWRALRARRLAAEFTCRACRNEQRVVRATDVDHIKPPRGDKQAFFDYANTQALCHQHHLRKTGAETRARMNTKRPAEQHPGVRR